MTSLFFKGISKNLKKIIESSKPTLLKVREEAHRFANKSSKKAREKIVQIKLDFLFFYFKITRIQIN